MLDVGLDCTTGQIRGRVAFVTSDHRTRSSRAIAFREPHVACVERGFKPEFCHSEADLVGASSGTRSG